MASALAALAALLLAPVAAHAFWTGAGKGSGASTVGTLSTPATTVPATATTTVAVSFTAATVTPASPALNAEVMYVVQRSADGGVTWGASGGTCGAGLAAPATSCSDTPPASGSYRYRVRASFRTWTTTSATSSAVTVTVPVLTAPAISARPAARSANPGPSFSFSGGGGSGFECRIDGGAYATCTSPRVLSALADGSHTFDVRATLGAATGPAASYTWIVDTRAPTITTATPSPSASTSATFTLAHPAYTSLQCRLDAAAFAACTSPRTLTALALGPHTLQLRAIDADGFLTPVASYTWTVATAAPTITAQPSTPTSATVATFAFNDPGFTSFSCRLDGGAFAPCNAGTVTYTGLGTGSHTFTVHAVDGAGVATADTVVTWTITAAPVITILNTCTFGGTRQDRVIGTTNVAAGTVTVTFYPGTTATGVPAATITTAAFTFGPFIVWTVQTAANQLTQGATYTVRAQQVDATGGVSNAPTCTFVAS